MRISKFQFQNQRKIRSQIIGPEFREMGPAYYVMEWSKRKLQGTLAESKASVSISQRKGDPVFQIAHLWKKDTRKWTVTKSIFKANKTP